MSVVTDKKLKQGRLQFKSAVIEKKRKLDYDTGFEDAKCRKIIHESSEPTNNCGKCSYDKENDQIAGDQKINNSISVIENDIIDLTDSMDVNEEDDFCLSTKNNDSADAKTPSSTTSENSEIPKLNSVRSEISSLNHVSKSNVEKKTMPKKITPKQLLKQAEALMRKEERERVKQEKERLKQEEKEEKEKERLAKLEAKNEEKRLKEEERKAREEEKRVKEEERKAKEEEKRQKLLAKEERRLKEEEKRQKEELERKNKEKTAALFTNFFVKNKNVVAKTPVVENTENSTIMKFMPFEVKTNMRIADVHRATFTPEKMRYLDEILNCDNNFDVNNLYLAQLRSKQYVPGHSENTWPLNGNEDDEDLKNETETALRYHCKLLQFCENRRPAYWGTWRKRSKTITGRTPFKFDSKYFEYDVDSDDEWIDEEPGESLNGSDDDLESEDEYEVDNDVFVPHGYLSDDEGQATEVLDKSPKSQKVTLHDLEREFEAEMKEKTKKLKPRVYGCIWIPNSIEKNENDDVQNLLLSYRAVWNQERAPFRWRSDIENLTSSVTPNPKSKVISQNVQKSGLTEFPDSLLFDLIKLVHGNKLSHQKLTEEFKLYALNLDPSINLTKAAIRRKLKEIAAWIPIMACWMVNEDVRQQHNLSDFSHVDNSWKYVSAFETVVSKKNQNVGVDKLPPVNSPATVTSPSSSSNPKKTACITNFIRVYRASEDKSANSSTEK